MVAVSTTSTLWRSLGLRSPRWLRLLPAREGDDLLRPEQWDEVVALALGHHPVTAEQDSTTIGIWNSPRGGIEAWGFGGWVALTLPGDGVVALFSTMRAETTGRTAERLVELMATREVRYLTQTSAHRLAPLAADAGFALEARRSDADYVLHAQSLARLGDEGTGTRGKLLRRLERDYDLIAHPERATLRTGLLSDPEQRRDFFAMYDRWLEDKSRKGKRSEALEREHEGLRAWPNNVAAERTRIDTLWLDGEVAATAVTRPMREQTVMGVALKSSADIAGATEYLRRVIAERMVREFGPTAVWNVQQDDGVQALRDAKTSYFPLRTEPKYAVCRR